jgi:hypothetical protein
VIQESVVRVVSLTARIATPVLVAAAVVGLGVYAWRSWLRLQEERRWVVDWEEFRQRHLSPGT